MAKGGFYEGGYSPIDSFLAIFTKKRMPTKSKFAIFYLVWEPGLRLYNDVNTLRGLLQFVFGSSSLCLYELEF